MNILIKTLLPSWSGLLGFLQPLEITLISPKSLVKIFSILLDSL